MKKLLSTDTKFRIYSPAILVLGKKEKTLSDISIGLLSVVSYF